MLLLLFDEEVWVFSSLSCLLGAFDLLGELFQFFQQALVGEAECLHLIRIGLFSFRCSCGRSAIRVALLVLHPWGIGVAPAFIPSGYPQLLRDPFYL